MSARYISSKKWVYSETRGIAIQYMQLWWATCKFSKTKERIFFCRREKEVEEGYYKQTNKIFLFCAGCESSPSGLLLHFEWGFSLLVLYTPVLIKIFPWKHCWSSQVIPGFSDLLSLDVRKNLSWASCPQSEGKYTDYLGHILVPKSGRREILRVFVI